MVKVGLAILYTKINKKNKEWEDIKKRKSAIPGYLREQYWATRFKKKSSSRVFSVGMEIALDRLHNSTPGDGFFYHYDIKSESGVLEWVEVTEVYAHDNAKKINKAMEEWNDPSDQMKQNLDKDLSNNNLDI